MNQARIVWAAMASSVLMLFVMTRSALPPGNADGSVLNLALTLVALADLGLSFVIPKMVKLPPQPAMLVALALCESAALFGLVLHVTTGWPNAWMLFALGGFGMLLHFPRPS
jgi:hypothetical protein